MTERHKRDISLHYNTYGSGMPLVMLHGNGEDSSYFNAQVEYFSRMYYVVTVDTRGHGKSLRGDKPFCLETFADDLYDFLCDMGLRGINLLGFSDGANIAMLFVLKYPGFVKRLILNGGNLYPSGMKPNVLAGVILNYLFSCILSPFSAKFSRKKELMRLMVCEPCLKPSELIRIECPTLVIAGSKDMIRMRHTKLIYQNLKCGYLSILEGDHFIASKSPEIFNVTVEQFLGK